MHLIPLIVSLLCVAAVGCSSSTYVSTQNRTPSGVSTSNVSTPTRTPSESDQTLARAFEQSRSNVRVEGRGVVRRILSDDNDGAQHQRFIVALDSGQTLLIAHNIDVAPRVAGLSVGDAVAFSGEYVWNAEGGVIHWTHRDPAGRHPLGWLKHNGTTYQ
jgi:ABC-type glycerol-3-phosphate transport system substrate-binding protein